MTRYDVIVIGAGAAGLMCAITAGQRGRRVLVIDHANKVGKKILLSGGGRCNFTNRYTSSEAYLSKNSYFCISALKRYTQFDFEALVNKHGVAYHEKTLGQLFCDTSSKEIVSLLLEEAAQAHVEIKLKTSVEKLEKKDQFILHTEQENFTCDSLVVASGGLSFPTMGASPFGYQVADQFGLNVLPVRAALVPLTLHKKDLLKLKDLSGVSVDVEVSSASGVSFREALLFTHRGLSGPAILQISSYWQAGETLSINFLPEKRQLDDLLKQQENSPNAELKTVLSNYLPKRLAQVLGENYLINKLMKQLTEKEMAKVIKQLTAFEIKPNSTEGYRTAEVTLGGVDTQELSSKTFEAKKVSGLYFIGEVIDVTGHLGGFNFQWAWSSGYCCGQFV